MNVAVATTSHRGNLLGTVAFLCGVAGAVTTAVLWLYQRSPHSPVLVRYRYEIANGGPLREDLILLAVLFGAVAIVGAILSSMGGPAKASTLASVCLGAFALTYPVMAWLDLVSTPLRVPLFPGTWSSLSDPSGVGRSAVPTPGAELLPAELTPTMVGGACGLGECRSPNGGGDLRGRLHVLGRGLHIGSGPLDRGRIGMSIALGALGPATSAHGGLSESRPSDLTPPSAIPCRGPRPVSAARCR